VELLENEAIGKQYPALAQAVATVGTPQIRNMATLGGNICTRTPCWYYMREGFSCRRQGGAECAAKEGENEFHAIFGTEGPCVSVHGSSAAPALIALDAKVRIVGPKGARELPVEKFFLMPKEDIRRENVLEANEILTHVILGKGNSKSATYVVAHKASHDWPVGLASVALSMEGETCSGARICLGAVAPIPWRAEEAEAVLAGKRIDEAAASQAADAAVKGSAPLAQNGYKVKTTHTAVKRAVLAAATGKW
jgi:xanthine dehydrogenase YagS FAD-binding subunit